MSDVQEKVWMTPEVVARLTQELNDLTASRAGAVTGRGSIDARILEIERILRQAEVGSKPDDGLVEPGMAVTVRFDADGSTQTFLIGTRELLASDPTITLDVYSPSSPLGAAIVGKYIGAKTSYRPPTGAPVWVEIVSATPFGN